MTSCRGPSPAGAPRSGTRRVAAHSFCSMSPASRWSAPPLLTQNECAASRRGTAVAHHLFDRHGRAKAALGQGLLLHVLRRPSASSPFTCYKGFPVRQARVDRGPAQRAVLCCGSKSPAGLDQAQGNNEVRTGKTTNGHCCGVFSATDPDEGRTRGTHSQNGNRAAIK